MTPYFESLISGSAAFLISITLYKGLRSGFLSGCRDLILGEIKRLVLTDYFVYRAPIAIYPVGKLGFPLIINEFFYLSQASVEPASKW